MQQERRQSAFGGGDPWWDTLTGLREQQKAYIQEVGRYQDRRSALTGQLALIKKTSDQVKDEVIENTTDPKTTAAWAQLASRKADLEAQVQRMLTELRPKHPDVLAKQAELESVKNQWTKWLGEWKEKIKTKQEKLRDRPDLAGRQPRSRNKTRGQ